MKKSTIASTAILLVFSLFLSSYRETEKNKPQSGSPIIFWTDNCSYGPIEIFINDIYQGDITKCFSRVPECASSGCVTVIISGSHNVWTAQTKNGSHKWSSRQCKEPNGVCNSERLD